MFRQDIRGSLAHAKMLYKVGIVTSEDCEAIVSGLTGILSDIETGKLGIDPAAEDIHTFIEQELTKRIGTPGKKLHTARSRNDQVALDIRIYLSEESEILSDKLKWLVKTLCDISEKHLLTVMPGYTHLQRAQPVTLAHYLMAYAQMFLRDINRLCDMQKRIKVLTLGSGALAGTTYPIDRQFVCAELGFNSVCANSMDGVSDRDFVLELSSCLSIIMMHLSRFAEEIILWCSREFGFVTLDDTFATGSSIMPQKKNPDLAELIRGKTARVYGDNTTLFTMMKALPLAYNKDMQEDKEAIFDALDTVNLCIEAFVPMLETASFNVNKLAEAAACGFINATDCADYLVKKGLAFRDAYKITGKIVNFCIENCYTLETLPYETYKSLCPVFETDIYQAINLLECVKKRTSEGGPAPDQVEKQIADVRCSI